MFWHLTQAKFLLFLLAQKGRQSAQCLLKHSARRQLLSCITCWQWNNRWGQSQEYCCGTQGVGTTMPSPQTHPNPNPKNSCPVGLTKLAQLDISSTNLWIGSLSRDPMYYLKKAPYSIVPELDRIAGTWTLFTADEGEGAPPELSLSCRRVALTSEGASLLSPTAEGPVGHWAPDGGATGKHLKFAGRWHAFHALGKQLAHTCSDRLKHGLWYPVPQDTLGTFLSNGGLWWESLKVRQEVILPLFLSLFALHSGLNWKLIKNIETLYSANQVLEREISTILIAICCRRSNSSPFSRLVTADLLF